MDDYLFAMFLAEDVIKSVLKKHEIEWKPKNDILPFYKGKLPDRIVVLSLTKAVETIIVNKPLELNQIVEHYTINNSITVHAFSLYIIELASDTFKNGFNLDRFIAYTAVLAKLACHLYNHCQDIPEQAVGVLGTVLISQIMTGKFEALGSQDGLKQAAFEMLSKQRNAETEIEYKTTSV